MSENGISNLSTKQLKQIAKLDIAQAKRQGKNVAYDGTISGDSDDTQPYYRNYNVYNINDLPTKYSDNNVTDNANSSGLKGGRPWQNFVTSVAATVNEANSVEVDVTTINVDDSTTLYWTVVNLTSADADFSAISGSFTINSNAGSFTVDALADSLTEGSETFRVQIRTLSTSGLIVALSNTVTINDTSLTPYEAYLSAGAPLTYSATFDGQLIQVRSTNFDNPGTPNDSYIKVNGTTIASSSVIGVGVTMGRGHTMAVINQNTGATISIVLYDTYFSPAALTAFENALAAVATGRIVVIGSWDATALSVNARNALNNNYGTSGAVTWAATRRSHIFVGTKN